MITTHTGARSWRNQRGRHRPTAVPGRIPAPPGDRPGVRPTARSEACRSQGLEPRQWRGPGGARASLAHGLEAVAATWFGEIWSRAHRLGEGRAAVADAGPDLIHDLRIYVRRLCALSDLLPRPPGARPMRRALRKEVAWAMPLSRARDWDVFTMEVLPQLCDADPDIDPQASAARAAPAPRSRTTRCTPTCRPNASRPCCACSGNAARRSPPPWPSARPGRCIARSAAASRVGTRRCARAWITPPTRGRGASMRRGSASNACAMPARRCCCSVHPASSSATSRPWPTCKARCSAQDFRTAAALGRDVCVSLSTGRLTGRQGDKAALRLLRRAGDGLRSASRRLLRRPSFWAQASRGRWPDASPAGAEAPRATA